MPIIYRLTIPSRGIVRYYVRESDAHASYHMTFRLKPYAERPPFSIEPVSVSETAGFLFP